MIGGKEMGTINLFFDTEFTGLRNGTKLISIGCMIGATTFYAETSDWVEDKENIDEGTLKFLEKEVIPGLVYYDGYIRMANTFTKDDYYNSIVMIGSEKDIGRELVKWILGIAMTTKENMEEDKIIITPVSDVMYYDMVLFNDLVKQGLSYADLKESSEKNHIIISPYGIDICDIIREYEKVDSYTAFDMNREDLLDELDPDNNRLVYLTKKHNSLYDARIIREIYKAYQSKFQSLRRKDLIF